MEVTFIFADENSTTEYSCEVEAYSNELGSRKLLLGLSYVISSSVDTEFYIYYGNHSRKRRSSPERLGFFLQASGT